MANNKYLVSSKIYEILHEKRIVNFLKPCAENYFIGTEFIELKWAEDHHMIKISDGRILYYADNLMEWCWSQLRSL